MASTALAEPTAGPHDGTVAGKPQLPVAKFTRGSDGSVVYAFGGNYPMVICAPLRLCTIQLQPGERVHDMFVGDSARWKVEPALSGKGSAERVSIVVKPSNPGLATSMVITTSRRVYHIGLKSSIHTYMARVSFTYKGEPRNIADVAPRRQEVVEFVPPPFRDNPPSGGGAEEYQVPPFPIPVARAGGYSVRGDNPSWRPRKVYNDGTRTYIEFAHAAVGKVPPIYVVTGGPFASRLQYVSYRVDGDMMVVDNVFEKAVLVSGMNSIKPTRVVIERQG